MMDLLETMKEIQALNFLCILWGGGAVWFLILFILTKMGGDPAGMRQLKRGSWFGFAFETILTIVITWYSIWFMNY